MEKRVLVHHSGYRKWIVGLVIEEKDRKIEEGPEYLVQYKCEGILYKKWLIKSSVVDDTPENREIIKKAHKIAPFHHWDI